MADAVVVPGGRFGPAAGMLMYAGDVAERRGATVHRHTWSQEPSWPLGPESEDRVRAEIGPALGRLVVAMEEFLDTIGWPG